MFFPIKRITIKRLEIGEPRLLPMIESFIVKAQEYERTRDSIFSQMNAVLDRQGAGWMIQDGDKPIGYFFAEVLPAEYEKLVCFVHELYIDPAHTEKNLIHNIDALLGAWARLHGAAEVAFFTRRDPHAFMRLLNNNWKIDSWVLKRCV